jgi:hypothetical protein
MVVIHEKRDYARSKQSLFLPQVYFALALATPVGQFFTWSPNQITLADHQVHPAITSNVYDFGVSSIVLRTNPDTSLMHVTIDTPGMPAHPCALIADFRLVLPFRAIVPWISCNLSSGDQESSEVGYRRVSLLVGV